MTEALGTVCTRGRGLLRRWWCTVGQTLPLDRMQHQSQKFNSACDGMVTLAAKPGRYAYGSGRSLAWATVPTSACRDPQCLPVGTDILAKVLMQDNEFSVQVTLPLCPCILFKYSLRSKHIYKASYRCLSHSCALLLLFKKLMKLISTSSKIRVAYICRIIIIIIIINASLDLLLGFDSFFSFLILYSFDTTLWTRNKPDKRRLPTQRTTQIEFFFYNPSLFAICTKYNKQMRGNRNKRGGRELSSVHRYGGGARPTTTIK
jgi:hypothetical protein